MQLAAGACSAQRHPHAGRTIFPLAPSHKPATCSPPARLQHQQHLRPPSHVQHGVTRPRDVSRGALAEAAVAAPAAAAAAAVVATQLSPAQVAAVVLGWACFAGSCFRSLPQIIKMVQHRSAEGLSLFSNITQLLCYTVMVAYNARQGYAFNTYGEVLACWLQDVLIVGLICTYNKLPMHVTAPCALAFGALCAWVFSPACPHEVLAALQLSTVFVMAIGSRVPQILMNARRGNSGVMSLTTCMLNVTGNAIRIFTTTVLTHDRLNLVGGCIQGCLNSVLLWQVWKTRQQQRKAETAAAAAAAVTTAAAAAAASVVAVSAVPEESVPAPQMA